VTSHYRAGGLPGAKRRVVIEDKLITTDPFSSVLPFLYLKI
jgi:hypothetical protein